MADWDSFYKSASGGDKSLSGWDKFYNSVQQPDSGPNSVTPTDNPNTAAPAQPQASKQAPEPTPVSSDQAEPSKLSQWIDYLRNNSGGLADSSSTAVHTTPTQSESVGQIGADIYHDLAAPVIESMGSGASEFHVQNPVQGQQQGIARQITAGIYNAPSELYNFLLTPEGIGTLATAELGGPLWKSMISAGFSTQAANSAIEQAKQGDFQGATSSVVAAVAAAHGASSEAGSAYPLDRPVPGVTEPGLVSKLGADGNPVMTPEQLQLTAALGRNRANMTPEIAQSAADAAQASPEVAESAQSAQNTPNVITLEDALRGRNGAADAARSPSEEVETTAGKAMRTTSETPLKSAADLAMENVEPAPAMPPSQDVETHAFANPVPDDEPTQVDKSGQSVILTPDEQAAESGQPPVASDTSQGAQAGGNEAERPDGTAEGNTGGVDRGGQSSGGGEAGRPAEPINVGVSHESLENAGLNPIRGEGRTWQDSVANGNKLLNEGADPELAHRRLTGKTGRNPIDDADVVRAQRARLGMNVARARGARDADPHNPELQRQYIQAQKAEQDWVKRAVKPVGTLFHQLGEGLKGEQPVDTRTFDGLAQLARDQLGRPLEPGEEFKLKKMVKDQDAQTKGATDAGNRLLDAVRRDAKTKMSFDQLRDEMREGLKEIVKDCVL